MPPRKRAKTSHASPTPSSQPKTPAEEPVDNADEQLLNDPWTDEEEIGLFKGLIKYKPTGIHKHFRLLSLHQYMLDNGYIHPKAEHTKPAGIWRKLENLYQLESLDERENARQLEKVEIPEDYRASRSGSEREGSEEDEDAGAYSEAANKVVNGDFDLEGPEFAEMKWARRLPAKQKRDESPAELPELNMADEAPVHFSPRVSVESTETQTTPTAKRGRGRAGTVTAKTKDKEKASAPTPAPAGANTRRSARKGGSVDEEQEKEQEKDEEPGEEGDEEEESEEEESEESTPAPRSTRNAKGARGRAGGSTKTQARGRTKKK